MTKAGEKTPITDEEAEAMAKRFVTEEEDWMQSSTPEEWEDYVTSKLYNERGYLPSEAQARWLEVGREQSIAGVGYRIEFPFPDRPTEVRFRELTTGQFRPQSQLSFNVRRFFGLFK